MADDDYHQQLRQRQADQDRADRAEADRRAAQEEAQRRLAEAQRTRDRGRQHDNGAGL